VIDSERIFLVTVVPFLTTPIPTPVVAMPVNTVGWAVEAILPKF
jgi:hypothetical protein